MDAVIQRIDDQEFDLAEVGTANVVWIGRSGKKSTMKNILKLSFLKEYHLMRPAFHMIHVKVNDDYW